MECHHFLLILQKASKKLFPRWEVILKHKDVLSFVYGLSDHPDDVIDLICDRGATFFAETALKEFEQECWNPDPTDLQIKALTHQQIHVIPYSIDELVRKITTENMKSENNKENINPLWNQHLSVCGPDCSDFILSRVYVIRRRGWRETALIIPETNANFENGANNDPVPYVIGSPHGVSFFRPLVKITRTLGHYNKVVITRVYSPNMCLKEKDLNLEGHLVLDDSFDENEIFCLIVNIELLKLQRIFFTGFEMRKKKYNVRCFEQVKRWVHFNSNMKSLRFDGCEVPISLIEHIAQDLYGEVELDTQQRVKGSSLQSFISNSLSTKYINILVRLNDLPEPKVLQLQLNRFEGMEALLDSGSPTLEKLYLENGTLSAQDINKFLDALTKGSFPKLNYSCLKNISNTNREFSQFSQHKGYTRLECINKITKEYLALENDIQCQTKLSEHENMNMRTPDA